jgi:hypothetical protein
MALNEVIRTSGDIRRFIAQTMSDVRSGDVSIDKGLCIAALAKEITSSMQTEVNVAKIKVSLLASGANLGKTVQLGSLLIEQSDSTPTLSGE